MTPGPLILADGDVLAIDERLARILMSRRGRLEPSEVASIFAGAADRARAAASRRRSSLAVVPIRGFLQQHADLWGFGTAVATVGQDVRRAAADSSIEAIVLDVDSPGGSSFGITEAASVIREARAIKPVIGVANSVAGSAAYWLLAAASEVVVTPGGEVGSVGVYLVHVDESQALEQAGLKVTLIASDPTKTWGTPTEPLASGARARFERRVRQVYDAFLADVAVGRGIGEGIVRQDWRALTFGAAEAVARGLADRIGTIEDATDRAVELGRNRAGVLAARTGLLNLAGSRVERDALLARFRQEDRARAPRPFDRRAAEAELAALGMAPPPAGVVEPSPSAEETERWVAAAKLAALR